MGQSFYCCCLFIAGLIVSDTNSLPTSVTTLRPDFDLRPPVQEVELRNYRFENAPIRDDSISTSSLLTMGPLESARISNSSLKRIQVAPWFGKFLRDEIFKYNQNQSSRGELNQPYLRGLAEHKPALRVGRSLDQFPAPSGISGRHGLGFMPSSLTTPTQMFVFQQQQAVAAALQQQMIASLVQQQMKGLQLKKRPTNEYDDGDSESDEYDDIDSNEFMPYPFRIDFIPPMHAFRRIH